MPLGGLQRRKEKMYTEYALKENSFLWKKDEEMFFYCMELLKGKLSSLEYNQFMYYYYCENNNLERAVSYAKKMMELEEHQENIYYTKDDDFLDEICCCLASDIFVEGCCDCCSDCCCCDECDGCGSCVGWFCLCSSMGLSWEIIKLCCCD